MSIRFAPFGTAVTPAGVGGASQVGRPICVANMPRPYVQAESAVLVRALATAGPRSTARYVMRVFGMPVW
jgi:hypothetical protein